MSRRIVAVVCAKDGSDMVGGGGPKRMFCPQCTLRLEAEDIEEIDDLHDQLIFWGKHGRYSENFDAEKVFKKIEKKGVRLIIKWL